MSDRRYEVYGVYEVCSSCGGTGIDGDSFVPATWQTPSEAEPCPECYWPGRTRLDSIPDALVEEAAKRVYEFYRSHEFDPSWDEIVDDTQPHWRGEARAALSVLFPGEEE